MKHKLFTTLLVMLVSITGNNTFAHDAEIDGVFYNFSGSEATVTYKGDSYDSYDNEYSGSVVIPETVEYDYITYTVTSIFERAFYGCTDLISVEIPNSVTSIGESAFDGCSKLQSVSFSNNLISIADKAFNNCFELSSINLPNSLKSLGDLCFSCNPFETIFIPANVSHIGINPFGGCGNLKNVSVSINNHYYNSYGYNFNGIIETSTGTLITAVKNTEIPIGVKIIEKGTFWYYYATIGGAKQKETSVILPEGFEQINSSAFYNCYIGTLKIPSSIKIISSQAFDWCNIDTIDIADVKAWCEASLGAPRNVLYPALLCQNGIMISNLEIPNNTTKIPDCGFYNFTNIISITIPKSVTEIGGIPFGGPNCSTLQSIKVEWDEPLLLTESICYNACNVTLYVPRGCKAAYEAADYWKDFKEIKEYGDGNATITMGSSGIATYSNNSDLNFTDVSGLKAYIASGFNPATGDLTMTRVYEVPAGEGLILKGATGSYDVPYEETSAYYANLLVGVPTATTVNPTDGSYTNFILANDAVKGIGFYPLASAGEIGPNKAYLQLPTSILPAASRSLHMVFEDEEEEEITGINALNDKGKMINDKAVYDLQGRRVSKPTRGLYIKDGKKIMVK